MAKRKRAKRPRPTWEQKEWLRGLPYASKRQREALADYLIDVAADDVYTGDVNTAIAVLSIAESIYRDVEEEGGRTVARHWRPELDALAAAGTGVPA